MCKRCGQCCGDNLGDNLWKESNLNPEQLKRLEELLNPLCKALAVIDGVLTCRVQLHYGYDAKPDVCKNYQCKEQKCK